MTVPAGNVVELTRALVRVDSRNPQLVREAPGETGVARRLADVLRDWGFRVTMQEAAPDRPNVIARVGEARPGAAVLMFNGHLDVVGVDGMIHDPFTAESRNGRIYGRGATDMKGGVAAMCAAAWRAARAGLAGEIIVAAVVDEEFESIGTRALIGGGVRADAAIVTEPTRLAIAPAHRGFTWVEVAVRGRAAHGSRYDVGVDAIRHAGRLLFELDRLESTDLANRTHPLLGHASLHAATIAGGLGWSTYPESCVLRIERRTLPGEQPEGAVREVVEACARVKESVPGFEATVQHVLSRRASDVALDAPIVRALETALGDAGEPACIEGLSAWTDAALLNEAGVPAICFGPGDIAMAHSAEEWVAEDELERSASVLARLAIAWCGAS